MPKQSRQGISIEENTKLKTKGRWLLYIDNEVIIEANQENTIRYMASKMQERLAEKEK